MTPEVRLKLGRRGAENHNFKGEWVITEYGRTRTWVWISPTEQVEFHTKRPYVLRSRYSWNRAHPTDPWRPGEIIHHRDGDTLNDAPENLEKLNQSAHAQRHFKGVPKTAEHVQRQREAMLRRFPAVRQCENCGAEMTRKQRNQGNRFCSAACNYAFRTGKGRTGW